MNCGTCKFWISVNGQIEQRTCMKINSVSHFSEADIVSYDDKSQLHTLANFGCNLHEFKEQPPVIPAEGSVEIAHQFVELGSIGDYQARIHAAKNEIEYFEAKLREVSKLDEMMRKRNIVR